MSEYQTLEARFDRMLAILSSDTFLHMEGLGNEVPFFICAYQPREARRESGLVDSLATQLRNKGISVLQVNLYSLCMSLLRERGVLHTLIDQEPQLGQDQLLRIDTTFVPVAFGYAPAGGGETIEVKTLEESEYPQHYYQGAGADAPPLVQTALDTPARDDTPTETVPMTGPQPGHQVCQENQKGVDFSELFGPYLVGATHIQIVDPYIRQFYQARNLMELIQIIAELKADDEEVTIELVTSDDMYEERQQEYLDRIVDSAAQVGVAFTWQFDETHAIHARHITTDTGWKILLDRGLDVYQRFDDGDAFSEAARIPKQRMVRAFEVTFLKEST